MTLLANLVDASRRVSETRARLAKVRELAACLRSLDPDELETGVHYLSGELPQGRFGIGYAVIRNAAESGAASEPSLSIADVDRCFTGIAATRGGGSAERRAEALRELCSRATQSEQALLGRLWGGELRRGALEGVMVDATTS